MDMEMSMDIIEMARDLGRALQADEKYQRYVNATLENDKDQVLQDLIGKFNALRVDINRGSPSLRRIRRRSPVWTPSSRPPIV